MRWLLLFMMIVTLTSCQKFYAMFEDTPLPLCRGVEGEQPGTTCQLAECKGLKGEVPGKNCQVPPPPEPAS